MFQKLINKGFIISIFLVYLASLSSCSYMVLSRKTQLIPETEGVIVSIADSKDGPYQEISSKKYKIKLNHFQKQYWIKQEKTAHVTSIEELKRTASNRMKKLDLALTISSNIVSSIFVPVHFLTGTRFSGSNGTISKVQTVAMYTNLGIGLAAWGAIIPAPSNIYPKKVELPRLIPILTKDTNQLFLTSGTHKFKLSKKGVRVRDYPDMKQYDNGYGYESRDTIDSFAFLEEVKMQKPIALMLDSAEYGIASEAAELENTLLLDSWTKSTVFVITGEKIRCELRTVWALQTLDELQYLYDKSYSGKSKWIDFNETQLSEDEEEEIILQAFIEASDVSFRKFLAVDTVQAILSAPVPIPLLGVEDLEIKTGNSHAASVSDAVKAVVTIVTPDGHGSGCIVSPDGYIITNAHVVENDTLELTAILTEDVEKKVPLKFIRMNDAIDLALLKLDTTGLKPLKIGSSSDIVTGTDVYAVGTPADIDLGQSVTRGIISGKRKFRGHSLIQTDVSISPGNSGGALINKQGIVLGIVTSALEGREINDIGFAVPANVVEDALKIKLIE